RAPAAGFLQLACERCEPGRAEITGAARELVRLLGKTRHVPPFRQTRNPLDALGRVPDPGTEKLAQGRRRDDLREVLQPGGINELERRIARARYWRCCLVLFPGPARHDLPQRRGLEGLAQLIIESRRQIGL